MANPNKLSNPNTQFDEAKVSKLADGVYDALKSSGQEETEKELLNRGLIETEMQGSDKVPKRDASGNVVFVKSKEEDAEAYKRGLSKFRNFDRQANDMLELLNSKKGVDRLKRALTTQQLVDSEFNKSTKEWVSIPDNNGNLVFKDKIVEDAYKEAYELKKQGKKPVKAVHPASEPSLSNSPASSEKSWDEKMKEHDKWTKGLAEKHEKGREKVEQTEYKKNLEAIEKAKKLSDITDYFNDLALETETNELITAEEKHFEKGVPIDTEGEKLFAEFKKKAQTIERNRVQEFAKSKVEEIFKDAAENPFNLTEKIAKTRALDALPSDILRSFSDEGIKNQVLEALEKDIFEISPQGEIRIGIDKDGNQLPEAVAAFEFLKTETNSLITKEAVDEAVERGENSNLGISDKLQAVYKTVGESNTLKRLEPKDILESIGGQHPEIKDRILALIDQKVLSIDENSEIKLAKDADGSDLSGAVAALNEIAKDTRELIEAQNREEILNPITINKRTAERMNQHPVGEAMAKYLDDLNSERLKLEAELAGRSWLKMLGGESRSIKAELKEKKADLKEMTKLKEEWLSREVRYIRQSVENQEELRRLFAENPDGRFDDETVKKILKNNAKMASSWREIHDDLFSRIITEGGFETSPESIEGYKGPSSAEILSESEEKDEILGEIQADIISKLTDAELSKEEAQDFIKDQGGESIAYLAMDKKARKIMLGDLNELLYNIENYKPGEIFNILDMLKQNEKLEKQHDNTLKREVKGRIRSFKIQGFFRRREKEAKQIFRRTLNSTAQVEYDTKLKEVIEEGKNRATAGTLRWLGKRHQELKGIPTEVSYGYSSTMDFLNSALQFVGNLEVAGRPVASGVFNTEGRGIELGHDLDRKKQRLQDLKAVRARLIQSSKRNAEKRELDDQKKKRAKNIARIKRKRIEAGNRAEHEALREQEGYITAEEELQARLQESADFFNNLKDLLTPTKKENE